jgi:hypothetical protein
VGVRDRIPPGANVMSTIFGEKMAFFSKANVMSTIFGEKMAFFSKANVTINFFS